MNFINRLSPPALAQRGMSRLIALARSSACCFTDWFAKKNQNVKTPERNSLAWERRIGHASSNENKPHLETDYFCRVRHRGGTAFRQHPVCPDRQAGLHRGYSSGLEAEDGQSGQE